MLCPLVIERESMPGKPNSPFGRDAQLPAPALRYIDKMDKKQRRERLISFVIVVVTSFTMTVVFKLTGLDDRLFSFLGF